MHHAAARLDQTRPAWSAADRQLGSHGANRPSPGSAQKIVPKQAIVVSIRKFEPVTWRSA